MATHPFFVLSLLLFFFFSPSSAAYDPLTPPVGNSLYLKTKAINGIQFYKCTDGDWIAGSAFATLLDSSSGEKVGNYSFYKDPKAPRYAGTWSLTNNPGDLAESGSAYSTVSGKKVFVAKPTCETDLSDYLSVASMHQHEGAASQVSYIVRVNTRGGTPPNEGYCEFDGKVITVPFQAEYHFYKQDMLPPSMPSALTVLTGQAIQGFYGTGVVTYVYDGTKWQMKGVFANMYDVPGGTKVGTYFTKAVADQMGGSYCWKVDNPNGFELNGKPACSPVQVSPDSMPWSLNAVTTSSGNSTMFGPYTYVQMVSTTGGLPPKARKQKPKKGCVYRSAFSAIYWFYCKGSY